ncbi:MAG: thioredoxin family protein [Desulfosalsimonadaceae bacterium]
MSIQKSIFFVFAFLFSVIIVCPPSDAADTKPADNPGIQWQPYASGIKAIKDQKKKGFLHFYTDWCTYCKVMNKNTFTDPKIIAYLNENFIPIRVNADKEKAVAREFRVSPVPDNWFITEDASSLHIRPGYIPPEELLVMLKFLHTDSFKTMKFPEFIRQQENAVSSGKPVTQ